MYLYFNIFYEGIWCVPQLLIFIHRHLKHKKYTCSLYDCTEKKYAYYINYYYILFLAPSTL